MGSDPDWFAEQFAQHRAHLLGVAYRLLGSVTEAEDALQEAWLRTTRADPAEIDNVGGWLTTVVARASLNLLRARRARPEYPQGSWLPEPVVGRPEAADAEDPEQTALIADHVGLALLVVLESLEPAQRLALVLHDSFGVPFDEIAPIVGRSPEATRQLASRARRRVRSQVTEPDPDLSAQRRVVDAFLAAARRGDFEALLEILDPDVVFRVDTGGRPGLAPARLSGARDVARQASHAGAQFASLCRFAVVNGAAGIVARADDRVIAVAGLTVVAGRVAAIDLVLDPAKFGSLSLPA